MKMLDWPVPVLAAVVAPQLDLPGMSAPAWVAAIIGVAYVLLSYLNWAGRLPGVNGERRAQSFTPQDRARQEAIYQAVKRTDPEKPDWPMVWSVTHETVTRLAELADVWQEDREEWRRDRARLELRITQLEEANRLQEHALRARTE